jgi:hypothetical protein
MTGDRETWFHLVFARRAQAVECKGGGDKGEAGSSGEARIITGDEEVKSRGGVPGELMKQEGRRGLGVGRHLGRGCGGGGNSWCSPAPQGGEGSRALGEPAWQGHHLTHRRNWDSPCPLKRNRDKEGKFLDCQESRCQLHTARSCLQVAVSIWAFCPGRLPCFLQTSSSTLSVLSLIPYLGTGQTVSSSPVWAIQQFPSQPVLFIETLSQIN